MIEVLAESGVQLWVAALGAAASAAVGAALGLAARQRKRVKAIGDGVRSLLRCELVRAHREHCIRGEPMALEDREFVHRTYEAYHSLGGNGTGTRLYEELMEVDLGRGRE